MYDIRIIVLTFIGIHNTGSQALALHMLSLLVFFFFKKCETCVGNLFVVRVFGKEVWLKYVVDVH